MECSIYIRFPVNIHQKEGVKHRETLEDIGECGLEVQLAPGEHPNTDQVP